MQRTEGLDEEDSTVLYSTGKYFSMKIKEGTIITTSTTEDKGTCKSDTVITVNPGTWLPPSLWRTSSFSWLPPTTNRSLISSLYTSSRLTVIVSRHIEERCWNNYMRGVEWVIQQVCFYQKAVEATEFSEKCQIEVSSTSFFEASNT